MPCASTDMLPEGAPPIDPERRDHVVQAGHGFGDATHLRRLAGTSLADLGECLANPPSSPRSTLGRDQNALSDTEGRLGGFRSMFLVADAAGDRHH